MKAIFILPLLALIIISCNSKEKNFEQELSKEDFVRVELKKLNLSIQIPKIHELTEISDGTLIERTIIDLNPQRRSAKQFSMSKLPSITQKDKYEESFSFENGAKLSYDTFAEDGGSGGTEHVLIGIFEFEGEQYLVTSTDQEEFGHADPRFCLKYLSTIERLVQLIQESKKDIPTSTDGSIQ